MHQHSYFSTRISQLIATLFLLGAVFLTSHVALAGTAVVTGINDSTTSSYEGLNTTTVTIYGGMAGTSCGSDSGSTCSSCRAVTSPAKPDDGLVACNDRRINPNLVLQIYVKGQAIAAGYPAIAPATASGSTTTGTQMTQTPIPTSTVTVNNPGTINIPWRTICPALLIGGVAGGGSPLSDCTFPGDYASATFNVGIAAATTGTFPATTDDYATVTIILRNGDNAVTASDPGSLAATGGNGVTYFEVDSGDNKGTIEKIRHTDGNGFPNFGNIQFRWVRVLFEKRVSKNTSVWNKITAGSPHTDLSIDATDANNPQLSPVMVTGGSGADVNGNGISMSIDNGNIYDLKLAVVDQARNVYYYTPAANDQDCDGGEASRSVAANGGSGLLECHTIRAAPVVGVLSDKVNCFITTAAYGSPMAYEVTTFRHFRDAFLVPSKVGLKFVRAYYTYGPIAADFIAKHETLRTISRGLLWPPLQFAKVSLNYGLTAALALFSLLLLLPLLALYCLRRRSDRSNA